MRIAIYDVDSKIPNLALMKISQYHKQKGDTVEFYNPLWLNIYDKIYASIIFNYSDISNIIAEQMEVGGSGYDLNTFLPNDIENAKPDYLIYKYPHSIGFTMRGCRFNCKFCIVPKKEGKPKPYNTINEIWTNKSSDFIVLLDNDFFGNPLWKDRINEIIDYNLKVNFSQGLNIRIITDEQIKKLSYVKFRTLKNSAKRIHFAWDKLKDEKLVLSGLDRVISYIKPGYITIYLLIGYDTTEEEDLYRLNKLKEYGVTPFVMPYNKDNQYQKSFTRYVNTYTYKKIKWNDYKYK